MSDDVNGFHEKEGKEWSEADRIGFYGCNSRVVRVGRHPKPGKPPRNVKVDCPACGVAHIVSPMWRKRQASDALPDVEVP